MDANRRLVSQQNMAGHKTSPIPLSTMPTEHQGQQPAYAVQFVSDPEKEAGTSATHSPKQGFRKRHVDRTMAHADRDERTHVMGKMYSTISQYPLIVRCACYWFPLAVVLAIPLVVGVFKSNAELGVMGIYVC